VLASLPRIINLCTNTTTGLVFASDPSVVELWELAASILCASMRQDKKTVRPVATALVNLVSDTSIRALPPRVSTRYALRFLTHVAMHGGIAVFVCAFLCRVLLSV
jgi:hypothetical protein